VTVALSRGTLTLTGDRLANDVTVSQPAPGTITVTPAAGTTVNRGSAPVTVAGLAADLVVRLRAGDDRLAFDLAGPIDLPGRLVIDYGTAGTGRKVTDTVNAATSGLTVARDVAVRYAFGYVQTTFHNLTAGGGVAVRHAGGDSYFLLDNLAGAGTFSSVGGNVTVTNMRGLAANSLHDTNVAGNVTFANGYGRTFDRDAGYNNIFNVTNTAALATVRGSVTYRNLTGRSDIADIVSDVHVGGDVTLRLGTGAFLARVNAYAVPVAPVIDGNLTVTGGGSDTIYIGRGSTGLTVGKNLTVRAGAGGGTVLLNDVTVGGATVVSAGGGGYRLDIDGDWDAAGSAFAGAFALTAGGGPDRVGVGAGSVTSQTAFRGPVRFNLGFGNDTLALATTGRVRFDGPAGKVVFDGGPGTDQRSVGTVSGTDPVFLRFE
jgi:hypothetical protein